jgi:hypothetical protein
VAIDRDASNALSANPRLMQTLMMDEFADPTVQTDLFVALAEMKKKHRNLQRENQELKTAKLAAHV